MGLCGQTTQRILGRFQSEALGAESSIPQTWTARRKAFATTVTSAIAAWFAITAKARLIAKLATRLAIAATACRCCLRAFLAWAVIASNGNHRARCGFGLDGGGFNFWRGDIGSMVGLDFCVYFRAYIVRAVGDIV
jgi:hypothetical protein